MTGLVPGLSVVRQAGDESRPRIAALSAAVYPPDVLQSMPWRDIESARSEHRIVVTDPDDVVVAAAGLLVREARFDGQPVTLGGVGGVMTMPSRQGMGAGRMAMEAVHDLMRECLGVQFGLLFCEPKNVGFYAKLGWRVFDGTVIVEQKGEQIAYEIMTAMVCPVRGAAPIAGRLDVCGLPW